jgi:hypothetical protein
MQQLGFDFLRTAPPEPIDKAPVWFRVRLDKKYSYGEIGVARNEDGTWARSTRDQFQGFCGHGGPFWGEHRSFDEALTYCLRYLYGSWSRLADGKAGSCCTSSHIAMARLGLKWLNTVAGENGIDMPAIIAALDRVYADYREAAE